LRFQAEARILGLEVAPLEIRQVEDIAPALESLKAQADALYFVGDAFVQANRTRIITFSLSARLPTIGGVREFVQAAKLPLRRFPRAVLCVLESGTRAGGKSHGRDESESESSNRHELLHSTSPMLIYTVLRCPADGPLRFT
jgi:hypothetical protein